MPPILQTLLNLPNAIIDGVSTGVSEGASAFILRLNAAAAPAAPTIPVVTVTPTTPTPSTARASTSSTGLTAPTPSTGPTAPTSSTGPTAPTPSTGPIPSTSHTQPTWLASAISALAEFSDLDLELAISEFQRLEATHKSLTAEIEIETAEHERNAEFHESRFMQARAAYMEVRHRSGDPGRG
ncbi:hypothetical protein BGW80DRAFT_1302035 [Lactifluus volemus]|nr:hypothetical protein BGW80DRAFT_1302035 [Lactifluus volemus]